MTEDNFNDDFSGFLESDVTDVDFFAVEDNQEPETPEEEQNPPTTPEGQEEEEQEQEDNLFANAEEQEDPEEEEEENPTPNGNKPDNEDPESETEIDSVATLNALKSRGLLEYELEEGEELTEEKAEAIIEDSFDGMFEERIEELFENVPDILKEMNKFVIKGGDINTYLQTIAAQNSAGLSENMDLEDEANQELVIRHGLKEEGYDDEYIESQIDFLKDSKRMEKHSQTHYKKWNDKRVKEQKALLKAQEDAINADKLQRREHKSKLSTFLKENEEVTGFTVTKEDRKVLPNYMSEKTVQLNNGNQITGMQKDLMRVLSSPTGSIQMAKLLRTASESGELNFEEIKKDTETKVVKKVRDNVRRSKTSIKTAGSANTKTKKPLAAYFD